MLRDQEFIAGMSVQADVGQASVKVGVPHALTPIQEATRVRLRLRDAGYTPVPAEGKACRLPGWTKLSGTRLSDADISGWARMAAWSNTGILCGSVRVIDIDIDDDQLAAEVALIVGEILGANPPVRVGRAPRMALFARSDDRLRRKAKVTGKRGTVEFLGHGNQVIVDGVHPGTKMPYQWEKPLSEIRMQDLPVLDLAAEKKLAEKFRDLLGEDPVPAVEAGHGAIQNGVRNDTLWRPIARAAYSATSEAELLQEAMRLNHQLCQTPDTEQEIGYKVSWAWKKKLEGQLWVGKGGISLSRDEFDLIGNPDTLYLFARLRFAHGGQKGKRFAVSPIAMKKTMNLSRQRLEKARDSLVQKGLLEKVSERRFRLRR